MLNGPGEAVQFNESNLVEVDPDDAAFSAAVADPTLRFLVDSAAQLGLTLVDLDSFAGIPAVMSSRYADSSEVRIYCVTPTKTTSSGLGYHYFPPITTKLEHQVAS